MLRDFLYFFVILLYLLFEELFRYTFIEHLVTATDKLTSKCNMLIQLLIRVNRGSTFKYSLPDTALCFLGYEVPLHIEVILLNCGLL